MTQYMVEHEKQKEGDNIHTLKIKRMNEQHQAGLSTQTLTREHFSSHSFPLFTSLAGLDSPR